MEAPALLVTGVYFTLLALVGLLTNVTVVAVYLTRIKVANSRPFALSLALCDLLTCVTGLPLHVVYVFQSGSDALCTWMYVTGLIPSQTSGLILVMTAVDRWRRICKPHSKQMTDKDAWVVIGMSVVVVLVVLGPVVPDQSAYQVADSATNVTRSYCTVCDGHDSMALLFPLLLIVPGFVVMCVAHYGILQQLKRMRVKSRQRQLSRPTSTPDIQSFKSSTTAAYRSMHSAESKSLRSHFRRSSDLAGRLAPRKTVVELFVSRISQATGLNVFLDEDKFKAYKHRTVVFLIVFVVVYAVSWAPHLIMR